MPVKNDIIRHWQSFKNPLINDILINLEKLEKELPDLTEAEDAAIEKFLEACKTMKTAKVNELEFITTLNQFPAAYMLFMVHKLQTLNSELVMKVISFAQKNKETHPEVKKFFQRNMVFEKSQLLGRIFSTNRMEKVLKVLQETI
jgi:hypothetical protein